MNEDFVPFELAKKLKEKGFDKPCFGHYENEEFCFNEMRYEPSILFYNDFLEKWNDKGESFVDTPTTSQVLKWLREEKNIHVAIGYSGETEWRYVIVFLGDKCFENPNIIHKHFNSYESAALAGIEYVLDNLI